MPKFNVHLLTSTSIWEEIDAEDEEEALESVYNDPLMLDYRKCCEEPYRLVAEEIEEDEDEEMEEEI